MVRALVASLMAFHLCLAAASAQADSSNPYERHPRTSAFSVEVGANSLASLIGVEFTRYVNPRTAIDFGVGLSGTGLRPGVRARYNFSMAKLSPFVTGGVKYGFGSGGKAVKLEVKDSDGVKETHHVEILGSPFIDAGLGLDYLAHNGFLFMTTIGWSQLLGGKNYDIADTDPVSSDYTRLLRFAYGSGVTLAVSFGKAF